MSRYRTEHKVVDVSPIPFFPILAKKSVVWDTRTGQSGEGLDRLSYRASDHKAWDNLKSKQF